MTDTLTALLTDIQDVIELPTSLAKRLETMLEREAALEHSFAHCSRVVVMKAFRPGDVVFIEMDRPVSEKELGLIRGMVKHYEEANIGVKMCVMNPGMKVIGREETDLTIVKDVTVFNVRLDQLDIELQPDQTATCELACSFISTDSAIPLVSMPYELSLRVRLRAEGAKWLHAAFEARKIANINITMKSG